MSQKARKKPFLTTELVARWPHINKPDDKFGGQPKYKCDLFIDDASMGFVDEIKECAKEWHGAKKNVTLPIAQDEKAGQTYVKTWSYEQPVVVDSEGNPIPPRSLPMIRMGSKVRVKGSIAENVTIPGVRLELRVLKILELAEPNNIPEEFKTVEGSYVAKHDDHVEDALDEEVEAKPNQAAGF